MKNENPENRTKNKFLQCLFKNGPSAQKLKTGTDSNWLAYFNGVPLVKQDDFVGSCFLSKKEAISFAKKYGHQICAKPKFKYFSIRSRCEMSDGLEYLYGELLCMTGTHGRLMGMQYDIVSIHEWHRAIIIGHIDAPIASPAGGCMSYISSDGPYAGQKLVFREERDAPPVW